MIDSLIRDFQLLRRADTLIGKIWLDAMVRRISLMAFAGLVAAFGFGMANAAGFYALQVSVGSVLAATIVAIVDLAVSATVMLVARNTRPGPDIELARDVRQMAVEFIEADARDLKLAVDTLSRELREARETLVAFVHNPLDTAAQRLLVPAAISIIRGLRSRKQEG